MNIEIDGKPINQQKSVKYLGVLIDCHLNWKEQIQQISKKYLGVLVSYLRLDILLIRKTLVQLYHAIILPFLSYGYIVWGNTYDHNIKPLQIIQRKTIRLITFSNFDAHTSPLFAKLNLLKLQDYIKLQTLFFMHQFNTGKLPKIFDSFFVKTSCKHNVNTRFASRSTHAIFQKFEQIMAKLIFDLMDLNYGMNSMKDSSFVLLINLKKKLTSHFISLY